MSSNCRGFVSSLEKIRFLNDKTDTAVNEWMQILDYDAHVRK